MSTLQVNTIENRSGERFDLGGGNKNLLINGSMNVWQRSTSETVTGGYHTADRWETDFNGLGTFTQSQSTDVPSGQGFGYSLKMDCTSADASPAASDKMFIEQKIEGQNLQHLLKSTSNAKKITLSFWVKSNKTGTYVVKFETTGGRFISKTYTIDSSLTWEKKTITVEGDTGGSAIANDNTEGLGVQWWLGAGANYTLSLNGSWGVVTENLSAGGQVNLADSTSNEWYMTGCQLEVGSQATNFEFESYENVYRKCQRYAYKINTNENFAPYGTGMITSTTCNAVVTFPKMREAPAVSFQTAGRFQIVDGLAGYVVSSITANHINEFSIIAAAQASGLTAGRPGILRQYNVGLAFIIFDAEL